MQPLQDVTVIDFSQFLAGPYCTMQLADFGADVIKVERPGGGDDSRHMGPMTDGVSHPFQVPNRNKRSLAVDLKSDAGRTVVRDLLKTADVVVENFRPGVTTGLGIDYAAAHALNPDVIYCSISGFGQTGPISQRPGFDIIAQGMAGFLMMTGEPGGKPAKFGVAATDLAAGLNAAVAIAMAYIRRLREGGGQYIDVSLLDAGLALTTWESGAYFGSGEDAEANGTRHRRIAPYQAYPTADGYVTVGANNQKLWEILCRSVIDRSDLIDRAEYADSAARHKHADDLEAELGVILGKRPTDEWVRRLDAAGVPGGPVLTYTQAIQQEQALARGMIVTVPHPKIGAVRVLGPAAKMSETPPTVRTAGPMLGQHSREVLGQIGYDEVRIAGLFASGVIAEPS